MAEYNEFSFTYQEASYFGAGQNYFDYENYGKEYSQKITDQSGLTDNKYDICYAVSVQDGVQHYYRLCYSKKGSAENYQNNQNNQNGQGDQPRQIANDILAYEVNEAGEPIRCADNSGVMVSRLFSDLTLNEGTQYTIRVPEGNSLGKIELTPLGGGTSYFSEGLLSDINNENTPYWGFAKTTQELDAFVQEASQNEAADAVADEVNVTTTEAVADVTTEVNEGDVTTEAAITKTVSVVSDNTVADGNGNSNTFPTVLFVLTMIAAAGLGGLSAFLYSQLKKEKENVEQLKSDSRNKDSQADMDRQKKDGNIADLQVRLDAAENDLRSKEEELRKFRETAGKLADELKLAKAELSKKASSGASENIGTYDMQIKSLNIQIETITQENIQLQNKISELERAKSSESVSGMAEQANYTAKSANDPEDIAKEISLSSERVGYYSKKYGDPIKFMEINVSVTGEVLLREIDIYKKAPILAIGAGVFLNPDFYRNLPSGNETYDNLLRVKDVFELNGVSSNRFALYGLARIKPARIKAFKDGYVIESKGEIYLSSNS